MTPQAAPVSQDRVWSQIIARAWSDEDFKERLRQDPRGVLAEYGADLPEGIDFQIVEDDETTRHLILPPPPSDDLSDEELVGSTAAWCFSGDCGRCGCGCWSCRCD